MWLILWLEVVFHLVSLIGDVSLPITEAEASLITILTEEVSILSLVVVFAVLDKAISGYHLLDQITFLVELFVRSAISLITLLWSVEII